MGKWSLEDVLYLDPLGKAVAPIYSGVFPFWNVVPVVNVPEEPKMPPPKMLPGAPPNRDPAGTAGIDEPNIPGLNFFAILGGILDGTAFLAGFDLMAGLTGRGTTLFLAYFFLWIFLTGGT